MITKKECLGKEIFGKSTRKIVQIGNSLAITLPAKYVKAHNIVVGDDMDVWYNGSIHCEPIKEEDVRIKLGKSKEP